MKRFSVLTSKTIWGGFLATVGYLAQPDVLAVLPKKVAAVVMSVGTLLTVIGARQAIAKNGAGQ